MTIEDEKEDSLNELSKLTDKMKEIINKGLITPEELTKRLTPKDKEMKTKKAINRLYANKYLNKYVEVIEPLKRGGRYEQMWKDFKKEYYSLMIPFSEVNVNLIKLMNDFEQKYFPKSDKKEVNKIGEHCQTCGKEYDYVWAVSDELWEKVTGIKNKGGLECIHCFDRKAWEKRIIIYWYGKEVN